MVTGGHLDRRSKDVSPHDVQETPAGGSNRAQTKKTPWDRELNSGAESAREANRSCLVVRRNARIDVGVRYCARRVSSGMPGAGQSQRRSAVADSRNER